MNENQKNIETCLPEDILAEVASVPTDAQFVSLVNESLDPLKQQAVEQAGSDAYEQVVETHKPYTFTSTIVQMKSNLILLLRRLWRFPFGTGTLRSLADMWSHYITRLSGNAEYGIPSRLDQLTSLPSAPLLLADRKINCVGAPDGLSLGHAVCSNEGWNSITEVSDDNTGWVLDRSVTFPEATKVTLNCYKIDRSLSIPKCTNLVMEYLTDIHMHMAYQDAPHITGFKGEEMVLPALEKLYGYYCIGSIITNCDMKVLRISKFHTFNPPNNFATLVAWCPYLEEFYAEDADEIYTGPYIGMLGQVPNIRKVVIGRTRATTDYDCLFPTGEGSSYYGTISNAKLIHLEIGANGKDVDRSMSFRMWNPSYVLSDNPTGTDLIEEGSTAENNLQQFLQNFHDYIAKRLATFPEGTTNKTLTLSAAVYSAIWDNNGDPLPTTICQEIDTIIVDTKHWRPNKAS